MAHLLRSLHVVFYLFAVHLLNMLAPALILGGVSAWGFKRLFHAQPPLSTLCMWACGSAVWAQLMTLVIWGRDGKMLGYGFVSVACAAGLLWANRLKA